MRHQSEQTCPLENVAEGEECTANAEPEQLTGLSRVRPLLNIVIAALSERGSYSRLRIYFHARQTSNKLARMCHFCCMLTHTALRMGRAEG